VRLFRRESLEGQTANAVEDGARGSRSLGDSQNLRDERIELVETAVKGERGIASVNRARSLQSRVSSVFAIGLMSVLGLSLLTWYYAKTASRQARAHETAQSASKAKAQGELPLPHHSVRSLSRRGLIPRPARANQLLM
jgi:hypothetical protein